MEFLFASGIGALTAAGVYLTLRRQTFPVIIGLAFLTYAVNLFLFAMGRLTIDRPPIIATGAPGYADPLPQALVLTAIVISFGMTALIVVLALRGFLETGNDAGSAERGEDGVTGASDRSRHRSRP
ncbi:Na+/H+ antiporter subunit C [Azospirillum argentinense]